MIVRYIESELTSRGFVKEKRNTGYAYNRIFGNIELICFIEHDIKLYFFSIYKWNNNRVKGSFCISSDDLKDYPVFPTFLFIKTTQNMPRYIGKEIDVHSEILKVIDETFRELTSENE